MRKPTLYLVFSDAHSKRCTSIEEAKTAALTRQLLGDKNIEIEKGTWAKYYYHWEVIFSFEG